MVEFKDYESYYREQLFVLFLKKYNLEDKYANFVDYSYFESKDNKAFANLKMPTEAEMVIFKAKEKYGLK